MPASLMPCDLPAAGAAAAAAQQLDPPARRAEVAPAAPAPASAAIRQRVTAALGTGAGGRRGRSRNAVTPLASAASCSRRLWVRLEPVDLGERRDQAGAAQGLLERPEAGVPRPRPDHDQALRRQAERGEPGREQVVARPDPDRMALPAEQPAEQRRGEARAAAWRAAPHSSCRQPRGSPPPGRARSIPASPSGRIAPRCARRRAVEPGERCAQPLEPAPLVGAQRAGGLTGRGVRARSGIGCSRFDLLCSLICSSSELPSVKPARFWLAMLASIPAREPRNRTSRPHAKLRRPDHRRRHRRRVGRLRARPLRQGHPARARAPAGLPHAPAARPRSSRRPTATGDPRARPPPASASTRTALGGLAEPAGAAPARRPVHRPRRPAGRARRGCSPTARRQIAGLERLEPAQLLAAPAGAAPRLRRRRASTTRAPRDLDVAAIHQAYLKGFRARGGELVARRRGHRASRPRARPGGSRPEPARSRRAVAGRRRRRLGRRGRRARRRRRRSAWSPSGGPPSCSSRSTGERARLAGGDRRRRAVLLQAGIGAAAGLARATRRRCRPATSSPRSSTSRSRSTGSSARRRFRVRRVPRRWAGLRTFAADRTPVVGMEERGAGLLLAGRPGRLRHPDRAGAGARRGAPAGRRRAAGRPAAPAASSPRTCCRCASGSVPARRRREP